MSDLRRHVEFASAMLVDTQGRFLFQQRDDKPVIRYPGMLGLFGGHREGNETFAECVSREVHEEIGYLVPPDGFEKMADYSAADLYGGFCLSAHQDEPTSAQNSGPSKCAGLSGEAC